MNFRLWLESAEPFVAYHQTSIDSAMKIKKIRRFSLRKSTQGIIWFTTDIQSLRDNTTGAQGSGAILKLLVTIHKPAGWKEYHDLLLGQLKSQGYDGAILPEEDGTTTGFVFDPKQIKIVGIISLGDI